MTSWMSPKLLVSNSCIYHLSAMLASCALAKKKPYETLLMDYDPQLSLFAVKFVLTWSIFWVKVQRWRSDESTRLPPMWPAFDSQIRRHIWVEFVGSLLCIERFSPGTPVSPLLKIQRFTWFVLIANFIVLIVTFAFKRAVAHMRYVVK